MKILYSPQFNNEKNLKYYFSKNTIKVEESFYSKGEGGEDTLELSNTFYFDISNLQFGKFFQTQYPITEVQIVDEEINIKLLNFIKDEAPEEERFPEWKEIEFEEFEIPEDAEIIELEELVFPEPEPSPIDSLKAENHELRQSLQSLRDSMVQSNKNTEDLIVTLLSMM